MQNTARPATTIAAMVRARAPDDSLGLVHDDRSWSWREVVAEAAARAEWLRDSLDPERPPHIGVLLPNVPEYVFQIFGAALAGVCVVGLNSTRRGAELARDIEHTDCQMVLADATYADLVEGPLRVEDAPWAQHEGAALPPTDPPASSLMCLLFTSGSTSAPKAVLRSQGRVAAGSSAMGLSSHDAIYCPMSLCHGNALSSTLFPALASGACIVLKDKFSATSWLSDIRRHGVTFTATVGRALGYILATAPTAEDRDHKLKFVLAPEASPRDMSDFRNRFGATVFSGYGSSEGAIALSPSKKAGSLGVAPKGSDLAVINANGAECATAQFDSGGQLTNADQAIGELVRRNPGSEFEGYWKNPEAEADRLRDGWFWSGDLAYRDEDGVYWFAGRAGDWLRVDSENFAASPVERIIGRFEDAAAAAVIGVPDPLAGDQVMAVVELAAGREFDPDAFVQFLDAQRDLGTKWAPRFVRLIESMPTVGNSKVNKRLLRREAWLSDDPVWWRPPRTDVYVPMTDDDRVRLREEFHSHDRIGAHPEPLR